jgi:hypothetical protein
MEITVYRDQPLDREPRALPAATYNLACTLRARSRSGVVFVPIRSMQILAILDAEECVFLDSQYKRWVEIAWQHFRPNERQALDDPVPFEAVYYQPDSREVMKRLQGEFLLALQALAAKDRVDGPARVLKFQAPGSSKPG